MKNMMGQMVTRQIPAELVTLMSPPLIARAVLRGGLRELRQQVSQQVRERFKLD
jgi:hypothetical protein